MGLAESIMTNDKTVRKRETIALRAREDCINAFLVTYRLKKRGVLQLCDA
jgi:hypothetical protein